jgi:L-threonylcarbamoyladenylate synthase
MTAWLSIGDPDAPACAAEVIRAGGLVVLPTDTVYGVAADPWQPEAVAALYAAKERPPAKAIPVLLAGEADAAQVTREVPPLAGKLAAAFWPGPLTIALPRKDSVPEIVSSLPTIGVRVPDHDRARAIIRACGGVLAVTSANRSDQPSTLTARQAADALDDRVALVLDGGRCPGGVPSTVVDVSGGTLQIVRPGPLDEAALRAALRDA